MYSFPESDVTEIMPNLWLGNCKAAYDRGFLYKYKIDVIITIREEFDQTKRVNGIKYIIVPVKDTHTCNINFIPIFDKLSSIINTSLKNNKGVLVHCKNGHHRSAAVIAAYMIKYVNYDYLNAIQRIKKLRPNSLKDKKCILEWLFKYYLHLHNIKNCNIQCYSDNGLYRCVCVNR